MSAKRNVGQRREVPFWYQIKFTYVLYACKQAKGIIYLLDKVDYYLLNYFYGLNRMLKVNMVEIMFPSSLSTTDIFM